MNIVCFIQEKWLPIGNKLKVFQDTLDNIGEEAYTREKLIPSDSVNTFCCIQMLMHWCCKSENVSLDTLIKAIKAPHIGLQSKIPSIVDALNSSPLCLDTKKDIYGLVSKPPEKHEQAYANLKADLCAVLSKDNHTISDVSSCLKTVKIIVEDYHDFPDLIASLENKGYLHSTDLSCLQSIIKCTKALELINRYERHLMADKTTWNNHTNHPNGTFLVGKIAKKPENITVKDVSDAKLAISRIVGIEETDAIWQFTELHSSELYSSEVHSSEVMIYWRIIDQNLKLHIPEIILSPVMKECKASCVTRVGIMTNGSLDMVDTEGLRVMESNMCRVMEGKMCQFYICMSFCVVSLYSYLFK